VASTTTLCTSSTDALCPALRQQISSQQRRFIALPLPDPRDQRVSGPLPSSQRLFTREVTAAAERVAVNIMASQSRPRLRFIWLNAR